jgi:hypothetical protein
MIAKAAPTPLGAMHNPTANRIPPPIRRAMPMLLLLWFVRKVFTFVSVAWPDMKASIFSLMRVNMDVCPTAEF